MFPMLMALYAGLLLTGGEEQPYHAIELAPHSYYDREPADRFSRAMRRLESGEIPLDRSSEKSFVVSLLHGLNVPVSSQLLVYSTTSLQLSIITPRNPRALFFNEELYVGWVPGGKVEIIGIDPEVGGMFYIMDVPKGAQPLNIERSRRCMNCHAGSENAFVPGLSIKSVIAGPGGGSLDAFRKDESGHGIPLSERFGGWYLSGYDEFTNHWANAIGRASGSGFSKTIVAPGAQFDWNRYPAAHSDILAHLLHEHQAGFVNRVVEAGYRVRTILHLRKGRLSVEDLEVMEKQAELLVDYVLFKEEAPLPFAVRGESQFKEDFARNARRSSSGLSLKDLELERRLFRWRCSYMVHTTMFERLPDELRQRVVARMKRALNGDDPRYLYLPKEERQVIGQILAETVDGFADGPGEK